MNKSQLIQLIRSFKSSTTTINIEEFLLAINEGFTKTIVVDNLKPANIDLYNEFYGYLLKEIPIEYKENLTLIIKKDGLTKKEINEKLEKWFKGKEESLVVSLFLLII